MDITVTNRTYFEKIRDTHEETELFTRVRVISVNSVRVPEDPPFSQKYWTAENVLVLRFDDVDDPNCDVWQNGHHMTEQDAEAIARFVEMPDQRPIIIHCRAGISRSAAIGTCLNEYYNKKLTPDETAHESFWADHPYISPNLHVMKLLWKRLGLGV